MSDYPKHIAYRRRAPEKSFHAVARTPTEEATVLDFIERKGYRKVRHEPVASMSDRERRQFIELEDIGTVLGDEPTPDDLPF